MTIRLRAHHLLCMLTYVGKGYTPGFTINYDRVAERLNEGEEIEIVAGPDDICQPLLAEEGAHCLMDSVSARDSKALESVAAWLGQELHVGMRIVPDGALMARLRTGFRLGSLRSACSGCEWSGLCDRVAAQDFSDVKIVPRAANALSRQC